MPFLTQAGLMGGHVRVGLEDSLFIQTWRTRRLQCSAGRKDRPHSPEMGRKPATPTEAREMLALKGGDRVEF